MIIGIVPLQIPFVDSQAPALADKDDGKYVGLYWGAAGIVKILANLHNISSNSQQTKITNAIQNAIDYIWTSRYMFENGSQIASWSKYPGLEIYPGQKYGAAGIIKALSQVYRYNNNEELLEYSLQAAQELMSQSRNSSEYPNWAYAYAYPPTVEPVRITDVSFGSLGIIDAFLDMYEITNNSWYMDSVELIYDWLDYTSRNRTINGSIHKILPWYNYDGSTTEFRSSFSEGNAGAIEVFLHLYRITQNQTYLDWADDITSAIINSQLLEGGWPFFIDDPGVNNRISWKDGSIGILHSLIVARENGINSEMLNQSLSLGFQWLYDQIIFTDDGLFIPEYVGDETGFTSHDRGLAGALQVFREYNNSDYVDITDMIVNEITSNVLVERKHEGNLITLANALSVHSDYYDISLSEGLGGITFELIKVVNAFPELAEKYQLGITLDRIVSTYLHLQNEDGSWNRQVRVPISSSKGFFPIVPFILLLLVLTRIRLKERIG